MSLSKNKEFTAEEFDTAFEAGEDMTPYLDLKSAKMHHPVKRITIDFPSDILSRLGKKAAAIGVTRTSLIKMWVAEHLADDLQAI